MNKQEQAQKEIDVFSWMKKQGYDRKASKDISIIIVKYLKDQLVKPTEEMIDLTLYQEWYECEVIGESRYSIHIFII